MQSCARGIREEALHSKHVDALPFHDIKPSKKKRGGWGGGKTFNLHRMPQAPISRTRQYSRHISCFSNHFSALQLGGITKTAARPCRVPPRAYFSLSLLPPACEAAPRPLLLMAARCQALGWQAGTTSEINGKCFEDSPQGRNDNAPHPCHLQLTPPCFTEGLTCSQRHVCTSTVH